MFWRINQQWTVRITGIFFKKKDHTHPIFGSHTLEQDVNVRGWTHNPSLKLPMRWRIVQFWRIVQHTGDCHKTENSYNECREGTLHISGLWDSPCPSSAPKTTLSNDLLGFGSVVLPTLMVFQMFQLFCWGLFYLPPVVAHHQKYSLSEKSVNVL